MSKDDQTLLDKAFDKALDEGIKAIVAGFSPMGKALWRLASPRFAAALRLRERRPSAIIPLAISESREDSVHWIATIQTEGFEDDPVVVELGRSTVKSELDRQNSAMEFTAQVARDLPDDADPSRIGPAFWDSIFEAARTVSTEEAKALLAKIVAAEARKPGGVSKRAMESIRLMERQDVELLQKVAALSVLDFGIVLSPGSHLSPEELVHAIALGLIAQPEQVFRVSPVDGCFVATINADEHLRVEPIYCKISDKFALVAAEFQAPARLTQTGRELVRLAFSGISEATLRELINRLSVTGPTCTFLGTASQALRKLVEDQNEFSRRRLDEDRSMLGAQLAFNAVRTVDVDPDAEPYYFNIIRASENLALLDFTDDGVRQHFLDYGVSPRYLWRHYRDYLVCHGLWHSPHLQEKSRNADGTMNYAAAEVREWLVERGIPNDLYDFLD